MSVVPELKVHRSVTKALRLFDADRLRWLDEAAAIGPLVALRMGPVKTFVVTDAELARTMLVPEGSSWMRPPALAVPIRTGVGENLFTQRDKAWALLQPSVAPLFRKKALESRLTDIDTIVDDLANAIPTGATVDLELAMGQIALTLAAWVMLGDRLDATRAREIAHHQRAVVGWVGTQVGKLNGFVPIAVGAKARVMKRHREVLRAYADDVIARAQSADRADDVLGALLRARPSGRRSLPRSCAVTCSGCSSPATRRPPPRSRGPSYTRRRRPRRGARCVVTRVRRRCRSSRSHCGSHPRSGGFLGRRTARGSSSRPAVCPLGFDVVSSRRSTCARSIGTPTGGPTRCDSIRRVTTRPTKSSSVR